jgi:hypothetical protein
MSSKINDDSREDWSRPRARRSYQRARAMDRFVRITTATAVATVAAVAVVITCRHAYELVSTDGDWVSARLSYSGTKISRVGSAGLARCQRRGLRPADRALQLLLLLLTGR